MARNPLIRKNPPKLPTNTLHKSAGILDDFAIRKNIATKEGTVEKVPVNDSDIANKKYVDDENLWGITGSGARLKTAFNIDLRAKRIVVVANPTGDQDAATKKYVDDNDHAESHTIVSHSDTTGTGAELDTLTDNSMADALHRHSELSASDGTPDQALVVDAVGNVAVNTTPTTLFAIKQRSGENDQDGGFSVFNSGGSSGKIYMNSNADMILQRFNQTNQLVLDNNGRVAVNKLNPICTFDINGAIATGQVSKTENYTATIADNTILCGAGNETFTVTLPAASGVSGIIYNIKNVGTGTITVDGASSETIDGATTQVISTQYDSVMIQCDGSNWHII